MAILIATGTFMLNAKEQRKRIALLGKHLANYQIEKLMEALTDGYLRALGESDPVRQQQVWGTLSTIEQSLSDQVARLAQDLHRVDATQTRMSGVPLQALLADKLPDSSVLDLRALMEVHAQGVAASARHPDDETPEARKQRAFMMTAELMLMQHSCHWFCRSLALASARLQAKHNTPYRQVVASVSQATRQAYTKLTSFPL